jgi:hypothetical protein
MADEISVSLNLAVNNSNHVESFAASGKVTQAASGGFSQVLTVATATQTLSLGAVTTAGFAAFRNLNTATSGTAYVTLGAYDGTTLQEFAKLGRGEAAVVRLMPTITLGAKSYGSAQRIRYICLQD